MVYVILQRYFFLSAKCMLLENLSYLRIYSWNTYKYIGCLTIPFLFPVKTLNSENYLYTYDEKNVLYYLFWELWVFTINEIKIVKQICYIRRLCSNRLKYFKIIILRNTVLNSLSHDMFKFLSKETWRIRKMSSWYQI